MGTLTPMIGYYGFLVFLLLLGIFFKYGLDYLKKKKEQNKK